MICLFAIIYLAGAIGFIRHTYRSWLYRDVESWPGVPAFNVGEQGELLTLTGSSRFGGPTTSLIDTRQAKFDYTVGGTTYHGTRGFPDGNGLPPRGFLPNKDPVPWTAYYKPSDPSVAVLRPLPYQGHMEFAFAGIALVIFSLHATFWIWGKRRERMEKLAGPPVDS